MKDKDDLTLIEGRNPVIEALKSGRLIKDIYIAEGSHGKAIEYIKSIAGERGIEVKEIDKAQLSQYSAARLHQGVIARVLSYSYVDVDDILDAARSKNQEPFVVLLDGITDPHNFGAIIRTAECMGAHGIIIPKNRSVGITPAVVKASAGAVEYVSIAAVTNIVRTMDYLKKAGLWIMGADSGGKPCRSFDFKGPIGLVIGGEGVGLRRLVKEQCDALLSIPMRGHITSLNASVAAGMLMYEISMQRLDR